MPLSPYEAASGSPSELHFTDGKMMVSTDTNKPLAEQQKAEKGDLRGELKRSPRFEVPEIAVESVEKQVPKKPDMVLIANHE
jgi:hypothetical protein